MLWDLIWGKKKKEYDSWPTVSLTEKIRYINKKVIQEKFKSCSMCSIGNKCCEKSKSGL